MSIKTKLLLTCATIVGLHSCIIVQGGNKTTKIVDNNNEFMSPTLGGKLFTSAWIQRSAEYQALCLQSYSLAKLRLDEAIAKKGQRPLAIVTDIDETIIDNSPNSVHQALRGEDYTDKSWDEWCDKGQAVALAGAIDFFRYADSKGVKIFYISNRTEKNKAGTVSNLRHLGFPQLNDEQFMFRTSTSDKTERRETVLKTYDIVLLLGDNLGDFEHIFDSSNEVERQRGISQHLHDFGKRFIVLPNPNYGTWEKAMNGGYPPLETKDKNLKQLLKNY